MFIYHLTDNLGWSDHYVYQNLRTARETALLLMDNAAWANTTCMTIHRIDTKMKSVKKVEYIIHGAHRAEAHKVEDE